MLKIGFDFDNTLVNYDHIFYELAFEKGLINRDIEKTKVSVRNYLRETGKESAFTLMQGEVYGKKILEIKASQDLLKVLKKLICDGHQLFIISHKTKTPFLGPKYDLHKAATKWLEINQFFSKDGINLNLDNVYFEETLDNKIERIIKLNCNLFIDDLPEILKKLDDSIFGLHFNLNKEIKNNEFESISEWHQLPNIVEKIIKKKSEISLTNKFI